MGTITAQPIAGAAAWHGSDLAQTTDWIRPFSAAAVAELDTALRAVTARGLAWRDITRDDFPLPGFGAELAAVGHELEQIYWPTSQKTPNSRALRPGYEVLWGSIEPGALRGGIAQS